jgi:hypothetical protein
MKNMIFKIFNVIVLILFLYSCKESTQESKTKNDLQYDKVLVSYNVAAEEWPEEFMDENSIWQNCIPFLLPQSDIDYKEFLEKYIRAVLDKDGIVYDETITDQPYSIITEKHLYSPRAKWESFLFGVDDIDTVNLDENIRLIDFEQYSSAIFFEQWFFNVEALDFKKTVNGLSPVFRFQRDDQLLRGRSGMIMPGLNIEVSAQTQSEKRMERVGKMVYEYRMYPAACNDEQESFGEERVNSYAPMLNSHIYMPIMEKLLTRAINGDLPVYDFYDKTRKLSRDEVAEKCNYLEQEIIMIDYDGNEVLKTMEPYLDVYEIISMVFEEELYVDWETLRLTKKVLSITPVRTYFHESGERRKKLMVTIKMSKD